MSPQLQFHTSYTCITQKLHESTQTQNDSTTYVSRDTEQGFNERKQTNRRAEINQSNQITYVEAA